MKKKNILMATGAIIVTLILVAVLLWFALDQDKPAVNPTSGQPTAETPTQEPTQTPTEAFKETEPNTEDVPETSNAEVISAFDGGKDANYLKKYGLTTYESPFAIIEGVNGFQYIDVGDGVEIYRLGEFCGWFAAWDFDDVAALGGEKEIGDSNLDAYLEAQFGKLTRRVSRLDKTEISRGVIRYDYEVSVLIQTGDQWLLTSGICATEEEMLARATATLNVSAYIAEGSNYGYLLCTDVSVVDLTLTKKLEEAISFRGISFHESRLTLETGSSAQSMYNAVQQKLPTAENYLEMCGWFKDYNGEKIHRIPGTADDNYSPSTCPDIVFYRADERESMEDIVRAMFKAVMDPLTEKSDKRPFTVTKYFLAQQEIQNYEGRENTWLLPYLNGYYAYEGTDVVTMAVAKSGSKIQDGLVELFRQGSDEEFQFVLVREGNVYRLQRAIDMGLHIETKEK